ncbi:MAG: hypothetical protein RXO22_08970 [Thermocladium sp.]
MREGPAKKVNIAIPEGGTGQGITSWGRDWSRVVTSVISGPRVMQTVIPVTVDFSESMVYLRGVRVHSYIANFN